MKALFYAWLMLAILLSLTACGPAPVTTFTGPPGERGLTGATGAAGTNGTTITAIQFCPDSVATYPSTFPEYGLCIGNVLYAVYSIPNAFLTEIVPGNYSSTAIGSSCSFTVKANCVIQGL